MMTKLGIEAILSRQREINQEMDRLQKETDELAVALRVIRRFSPSVDAADRKLGPPRPEGTPTLFEMTEAVVRTAEDQGKRGLVGREIVEKIGEQYWPGVKGPQILPSIYQFVKKGRLRKTNEGLFLRVKRNETPDAPTSGASDDEGGASSSSER